MFSRRVILSLACIVLFLSAQTVAAQPAPRAVPPNDSFIGSQPITLGKTYTAKNVDQATVEAGQPGVFSCGAATAIYHSVWYDFVSPRDGATVHFSTQGTLLLDGDVPSYDTVLAVFRGSSLDTLVQVACNNDSAGWFSTLEFFALPGIHYYILAGTYSSTQFEAGSQLKLVTRVLSHYLYPENPDFEQPLDTANWKLTNPSEDGIVCGDPTYQALFGACAFRFQGNTGENSKLTQTIPWIAFVPRKNGLAFLGFYFRVMGTTSLGSAKLSFTVVYSDGTPPTKEVFNLTGRASGDYRFGRRLIYLASSKVTSVKLCIAFKSTSGMLLIDYPYLSYVATAPTRERSALPLPPGPVN